MELRQDVIEFLHNILTSYSNRYKDQDQISWCEELKLPSNHITNNKILQEMMKSYKSNDIVREEAKSKQKRKREMNNTKIVKKTKITKHNLEKEDMITQPVIVTPSPKLSSEEVIVTKVVENEASVDSTLSSIKKNADLSICVMCEGLEYDFIDTPGDGNCFYYSLLHNNTLRYMFSDQQNFREQLVEDVRKAYDKDVFIPSIFTCFGKNYESWCCETVRSGKWGGDLEATLIDLLYKIRVTIINTLFTKTCSIEVLNSVNNFIVTQDTNQLPTRNFEVIDSVTILHHRLLNIDSKDPYCFNHFGFLRPR